MAEHVHVDAHGDKRIALLIAILALCLAVVETGAKSAQTEALARNVESANLWAFFQARTIRQTTVRTAVEQAELQKASADAAVRSAIEVQQKTWRDTAARYESEPATGEGRKELSERAKASETQRDHSMAQYHFYEYASAAFQVAIVVASASIITSVPALALASIGLAVVGVALGGVGWIAPESFHF